MWEDPRDLNEELQKLFKQHRQRTRDDGSSLSQYAQLAFVIDRLCSFHEYPSEISKYIGPLISQKHAVSSSSHFVIELELPFWHLNKQAHTELPQEHRQVQSISHLHPPLLVRGTSCVILASFSSASAVILPLPVATPPRLLALNISQPPRNTRADNRWVTLADYRCASNAAWRK